MHHLRSDNIVCLVQERRQNRIVYDRQELSQLRDEVVGLVSKEKDARWLRLVEENRE
jgi:hypothetical protein